ncbi:MAG: lysostaphin resistance A-like protein [Planctomycetota bacterium]
MDEPPYQFGEQSQSADGSTPADLSDADEPEREGTEPPAPQPRQPPNFCPRCGARWDASWKECPHCLEASLRAQVTRPAAESRGHPLRSALSLYFALLATSAVGIILARTGALSDAATQIMISVVDIAIVLLWIMGASRSIRPALSTAGRVFWYPLAVGLGFLTFAAATAAVELLTSATGAPVWTYSEPLLDAGYGWAVIVLLVCVQPPIIEELAFRGVILARLTHILGSRDAVIVSAAMFMVLHLAVFSFPHLLLMGLVLGYLRIRSGSLYPCMAMHFTHNLLVILAEAGGS